VSPQLRRHAAKRHARTGGLVKRPVATPFVVPASRHEWQEVSLSAARPVVERRTSVKSGIDRTPILVLAVLASALAVCGVLAWLLTFVLARGEPGQGRPPAVRRDRSRTPQAPDGGRAYANESRRAWPAQIALEPFGSAVHEECEIEWFRGYVKSQFLAVADRTSEALVRESPWFAWRGTTPPPQEERIAAARDQLLQALLRDGWEWSGVGAQWYSDRLERTVHVGVDA
jgi:hypothetical protein